MKKKSLIGLGALVASAAVLASALPAQAFTPTLSEVRYLAGPPEADWDDSWNDLALTSDAATAVWSTSSATFIVDVASNTATTITGSEGGNSLILDPTGTYAYLAEETGVMSDTGTIFKVDMATKAIVATWLVDTANSSSHMFFSADGSSLFVLGATGSWPNTEVAVAKVNLSSGVVTTYEEGNSGFYPSQPAYDTASGLIYIPTSDTATGNAWSWNVFDTASNTFSDLAWTDSGELSYCDFQSGVLACLVDDTVDYVATIDATGGVVSSANVDTAVSDADSVTLTPDGTQAYVYGDDGGFNNAELIDMTTMSSVLVLNMSTDYQNVVKVAPDAGQIWFTADYVRDYDGGYQVVQFAEPKATLPDTGLDSTATAVTAVSLGAAGVLLLGLYRARRRAATSAK
jgi:LPXTG-motif cell wall-anchored protein